jgi:tetratricopeptide (TPR) repeat protein/tRNA A-37 threonylcarbamoyl transferase component Bud32
VGSGVVEVSAGAGNAAEEPLEQTGVAIIRGGMIGRYIVLGLLGKGGMGVVYSAYDPELDRKVALKLLRVAHRKKGEDLDAKRTRLLREAKAIARLSHPSVVVVYDVGTYQDQVFIAMELVDGMTAIRWRDTRKPSWKEVLRVFIDAGEGISAAHAANLIHRDFKPDNVMVTRDGKVRVMDFGLARTMERVTEETITPDADADGPTMPGMRPAEPRLTNEGNVVGTPAYMPPEQYLGVTDERSDQFSFCVSLYECIYGQHPFEARTSVGLTSNMQAGRVHDAPAHTKVPLWVRKILLKGLKPRPEDRYQSMSDLLEALRRDPAIARRRWFIAGGVLLAASGLAFGVERAADSKRAFCSAGPDKVSAAWELPMSGGQGPRHTAVAKAFVATGKPYAQDAIRGVTRLLDEYAARWVGLYKDACEATHVRGEQSEELLDLRMSCLNERLSGLRALTDLFSTASSEVIEHAVDATHALTPVDGCSDVKQLKSMVPPPDPAVRERVDGLRRELGQIKALRNAGKFVSALDRLKSVEQEARALDYRPLEAEAAAAMASANVKLGRNAEAEKLLGSALRSALASRHDDLLPEISSDLIWVVGFQNRFREAEEWSRFAQASIERSPYANPITYAWILNNTGAVFYLQKRFAEANEYWQRAYQIKAKALGPDDPDIATALGNIALVLNKLGRTSEALDASNRGLRITRQALGEEHPAFADDLSNRGEILLALNQYQEALEAYGKAEGIWEREFGPDAPSIAYALSGAGRAMMKLGNPRGARPAFERALRILEKNGAEAARRAEAEFGLAMALWAEGVERDRAISMAQKAAEHSTDLPALAPERTEVVQWLRQHPKTALATR